MGNKLAVRSHYTPGITTDCHKIFTTSSNCLSCLHPVVCYSVVFLATKTNFFKQNQSSMALPTLVLF